MEHSLHQKIRTLLCGLLLSISVLGCAAKETPPPPLQTQYTPQGIVLNLSATTNLNNYQDKPHTVRIVVYQLDDPSVIQKLHKTPESLRLLLEGKIDNPGLISRDEYFIQPSEKKIWKLDRLAKTRWIAVVAGYFDLRPEDCMLLAPVPLITEESGWIKKTRSRFLGPLLLHLYLGEYGLSNMETFNADAHL